VTVADPAEQNTADQPQQVAPQDQTEQADEPVDKPDPPPRPSDSRKPDNRGSSSARPRSQSHHRAPPQTGEWHYPPQMPSPYINAGMPSYGMPYGLPYGPAMYPGYMMPPGYFPQTPDSLPQGAAPFGTGDLHAALSAHAPAPAQSDPKPSKASGDSAEIKAKGATGRRQNAPPFQLGKAK
jgi:hypothetical protein